MGIEPDPGTFNNACPRCFDANETPERLILFLAGISIGDFWNPGDPMPPNGHCDLLQLPGVCEWAGSNDQIFNAGLLWHFVDSRLRVEAEQFFWSFISSPRVLCERYFVNGIIDPVNNAHYGGYGYISTAAEMQAMIETVLPVTGPEPMMYLFPMVDNQIVIRFANRQNGANIKLRIDV